MTHDLNLHFDGPDYDPKLDKLRLTGQILRVFDCMKDGKWRTLNDISKITNDPHASISAQLRHLRKDRFGAHIVNKRRTGSKYDGLFEYQLIPNPNYPKIGDIYKPFHESMIYKRRPYIEVSKDFVFDIYNNKGILKPTKEHIILTDDWEMILIKGGDFYNDRYMYSKKLHVLRHLTTPEFHNKFFATT